jgi:hypothetical protein
VRSADGPGELALATWQAFAGTELLDQLAWSGCWPSCRVERGLDTTRPILVVIDGAKALRRAVTDVFDHPSSNAASYTSCEM